MAERDKKDGEEAKGEENAEPQEEVQGKGLGCGQGRIVGRGGNRTGTRREGFQGSSQVRQPGARVGWGGPTTADWLGHSEVWAGAPRWEVPGSLRQQSGAEVATYLDDPNSGDGCRDHPGRGAHGATG